MDNNLNNKMGRYRLYYLIDMYLSGNINEPTFCDEFYLLYDLDFDKEYLTNKEHEAFSELGEVSGRFSEFEEDHPVCYTKEELRQKIMETKEKLKIPLNMDRQMGKYRLYSLIEMYLSGNINESTFCKEFWPIYNLKLDKDILTEEENGEFQSLFDVADRFSEVEGGDGFFYTKEELRQKILETKEKLSMPLNMHGGMDKYKIYYLMDMYLTGNINGSTFCNEFCRVFDNELDFSTLTEEENRILSDLALVVYRFSEMEAGRILDSDASYKEDELRKKILETLEKLEVAKQ